MLAISGLSPATTYRLEVLVDGASAATASVTTLPTGLPRPGEKPFTLFLGSCFCRRQDERGNVQRSYAVLSRAEAPVLNLWAGDQVYLDSPWHRFSLPRAMDELEAIFRENYELTWSAGHGSGSLGRILASAANYFTSDDHEFWNNYPNRAAYVGNSWTETGRKEWTPVARDFYRAFQTRPNVPELRVGNVSLRMVDTRVDRDAGERRFMTSSDLDRVCEWLQTLTGPGFLVLGQPVFVDPHGIGGHFFDWGLADYDQYAKLVRALSAVEHSVVVLTGDVHYGRIARCMLRSGAKIIEIISSPMALVDPKAQGSWQEAPRAFPSRPIRGVVSAIVETE
ncbi:MAG: alkaline phosphatase D family protein, partial [Actinobacteria bacterium]|nr:alkaline phosphatase D family protein [Actinomycetota bacterium]